MIKLDLLFIEIELFMISYFLLFQQSSFTAGKFVSSVEVDTPSTKIYRFHGAVVHPNGKRVPLNSDNLLLRECRIKNTDYVEGIVVYAGD